MAHDDTMTVGDMSAAAYGYTAGYQLLAIEKSDNGYARFVFWADDAKAFMQAYRNPQTMVSIQQYMASLKYLQTLVHDTAPGTTNRLDN